MRKILLFSGALLLLFSAWGQYEEKDFVRYTVREGLSENYITCLGQDEWGYMWIGTDIGLNRFDGHSFKHFFQGTKTLPLLSSNIGKLKSFGPHQLGIINHGGFQLLNTKNLSVTNYTIPDSTAFSIYRNSAWDAIKLPGNSYAVTTASGFYVFNEAGKLNFRHDAYQLSDIGQKRILFGRDIFTLNDKEYLVYINGDGLAYYGTEKNNWYEIIKDTSTQSGDEWAPFYTAALKSTFGWNGSYQVNRNEFIFMQYAGNSIVYYNKAINKKVVSPLTLPFIEFTWESKITLLNDSSFLVNGGYSGFYLFHINRMTGKITSAPSKFLPGHKIQCLFLDKDQRLWAGTSKGLLRQKLVTPVIQTHLYQPSSTDSITGGLSCVYRYKDKLYLGRFSLYKGLVIADAVTGKAEKQIEFFGKKNQWNEIRSIQMYHPDTLWIGTSAGPLWFAIKTQQYGKLADGKKYGATLVSLDMLAPAAVDGYAWMCGVLKGIVARYHIASRTFTFFSSNTSPALPFDRVKSIAYDSYGDVWIGGHSLARFNTKKELFDTLISVYAGTNKYQDDILVLVADKNGSLWLHNASNGLLEYRIKEKKFVNYTMKDGLPSDVFYGFSPVINNNLWISGHNNLTKFNTRTKKMVVYDYQDGLPEDKPTGRYLYHDTSRGMLYLLNQYILSTLSLPEPQNSGSGKELMIEELSVNNKDHSFYPMEGLRLKYNQNNLSLYFGIINFESGDSYQFAYKLTEAGNWTDLGSQRTINLTGLSPGNYTIWLRGTGKSGEQKMQRFSFVITPPFWKTTWFLVAVCGLLVSMIWLLYRYRIRQIRQNANIDKLLSQAEMKALHAQMNPHFIFNSLNSIREMILSNQSNEASHFLSKFAHLIRMTLDQSGQSFISLRSTMEYLTRYIEMEQIRNSHFTCRILADDELDPDETVLPPMLIQPFVENAIWHGTTGTQKSININIDFKRSIGTGAQGLQLICIIEDNGIGISQSLKNKESSNDLHHSVGIVNIHNRIRLLNEKYNLESSVTIEDKLDRPDLQGTGTVVTLCIPLEIKE